MPPDTPLRAAIRASHEAVARVLAEDFPRAVFDELQGWQRTRLARTHADLAARAGTRAAVIFFLEDLYGGLGFLERDRQLERVLPLMERLLPDAALQELAGAFELQALSLSLDADMALILAGQKATGPLDEARYGAAYREIPRSARERQIRLIHVLGRGLSGLVESPLVLQLVRAMRLPAKAAGVDQLQAFLERGLMAFRALPDRVGFVDTVTRRERRIMQRLYAGRDEALSATN